METEFEFVDRRNGDGVRQLLATDSADGHARVAPHPHPMFAEKGNVWTNQDAVTGPTAASVLTSAFQHFPNRWCLGWRPVDPESGALAPSYSWLTFQEVAQRVRRIAAGLCALGVPSRSHLAICSPNRLEWYLVDFACVYRSIITVGLHTNSNSEDMLYILQRTQATCVVCSPDFVELFIQLKGLLPSLRHIIVFGKHQPSSPEESAAQALKMKENTAVNVIPLWQVEEEGDQYLEKHAGFELEVANRPDDVVTVIYTSGSTGCPKGTIYTESMWHKTLSGRSPLYPFPSVYMTSGPLSASSTRKNTQRALCNGSRVGCFSGGVDQILMEIPILRPTIVSGPPITWITVHQLFTQAVQTALSQAGEPDAHKKREIKAQVSKRFKEMLGNGCIRNVTVGGAPVSKEVVYFVKKLLGVEIRESYGATEIGGIYSDGRVDSSVDVKLEDWEEYKTTDQPYPRGEILVKSPSITPGYYLDEEQTKENFVDGWFRTGDIGEMQEMNGRKFVKIIDRKKNLFKLAQGFFVVPEKIEAALTLGCPSIKECFVYGDGTRSHLVCIVVPSKLPDGDDAPAEREEELKLQIINEIRAVAQQEKMKYYDVPRAVHIAREPFKETNQQRTITGKLNRRALAQRYREEIEAMYAHTATQVHRMRDAVRDQVATILSSSEMAEGQTSLLEMGGDSLGAVHLMKAIRERWNVNVPLAMLLERPIDELADYIERNAGASSESEAIVDSDSRSTSSHSTASSSQESTKIDWRRDSRLHPETLRLLRSKTQADRSSPVRGVFLTGVTGFLGAFLLHALLRHYPDVPVWCLVRVGRQKERDEADALGMERIRSHMQDYELWDEACEQRVRPAVGELSMDGFGLDSSRFEELARAVDVIVHCGAWVNSLLSYASLYKSNVVGTQNVLRLAVSGDRLATVHHISSLSVLQDREQVRDEDEDLKQLMMRVSGGDVDKYISDLKSGYRQTKCVAELLVRRARKQGLRVNVFRCGMIVGETGKLALPERTRQGGVANESDWVSRLLGGIAHMRSYPACKGVEFNLIPVDFAAEAIVKIAKHGEGTNPTGHVYHINNFAHSTSFELLLGGVRRYLESAERGQADECSSVPQLEAIMFLAWRKRLYASNETNPLFVVRSMFYSWFPRTSFVDCTNTVRALQALSSSVGTEGEVGAVESPRIDEEMIARWLARLMSRPW